jgi:peptidoglycan/LPS O-acetylase OafA/YrhL
MSAQLDSRTNNFDFIRLFLAVLVIFSHSFPLTGEPANELFLRATRGQLTGGQIAVDAFFLGDHPKAAIDDQVKSGHREKA